MSDVSTPMRGYPLANFDPNLSHCDDGCCSDGPIPPPEPTAQVVVDVDTDTLTVDPDQMGWMLLCTHEDGCAVTVPTLASAGWTPGARIDFVQMDADDPITFTGDGGVTIMVPDGYTAVTRAQGSVVSLQQLGEDRPDEWIVYGDLAAE